MKKLIEYKQWEDKRGTEGREGTSCRKGLDNGGVMKNSIATHICGDALMKPITLYINLR